MPNDILLTGTRKDAVLDIELPCTTEDEYHCYTTVGQWRVSVNGENGASIDVETKYNPQGTIGNKGLDENHLAWVKETVDSPWVLNGLQSDTPSNPEVCRWWTEAYGEDHIGGKVADMCQE